SADTRMTAVYTPSLHDALPIFQALVIETDIIEHRDVRRIKRDRPVAFIDLAHIKFVAADQRARKWRVRAGKILHYRAICERAGRSEEHTSELQSRENLVCRLLL